jgi:hypothetical protein
MPDFFLAVRKRHGTICPSEQAESTTRNAWSQPLWPVTRYSTQMPSEAVRHSREGLCFADCPRPHWAPARRRTGKKLFDAAVNRKVDGTFTDMTH